MSTENQTIAISFTLLQVGLWTHGLSIWKYGIDFWILSLVSQFFELRNYFSRIVQSLTRPVSLSTWMLIKAIRINSFFSFKNWIIFLT